MPLDFPTNPALNDTYSFGGKTWVWNGQAWQLGTTGAINDVPIGNITPSTGAFTTLTANTATFTGNISADYLLGNGSQLTGLPEGYGNANVIALGESGWSGNIVPGANVTYDLGTVTNRWRDIYLAGNTIYLGEAEISANATAIIMTNPQGGELVMSGVTTDVQADTIAVTGNISGGNLSVTGNVSAGNVSATNIVGTVTTASQPNITGLGTLGNLSVTGNISAGNVSGTNIVGTLTTASQPNITSVGTLGSLSVTGNISAGNLSVSGIESVGTLTINNDATIVGNLTVQGNTITANVTSLVVSDPIINLGRGANNTPLISNDGLDRGVEMFYYTTEEQIAFMGYDNNQGKMILASNVSVSNNVISVNEFGTTQVGILEAAAATVSGNVSTGNVSGTNITGTIATASQPNITSVGTLGSLSVTGNVSTGNVSGTNITGTIATASQPNITGLGTLGSLSVTGNVSAGNVSGTNLTGTIATASQPNITGLGTLGSLAVTGNVSAGNVSGTNITGTIATASQPNITGLGTLGSLAVTGNVSAGNLALTTALPVSSGGTGQSTYSNGQLLIGKTDGTLAKATLTAGSNVTITNGDGTITIASTGGGGGGGGTSVTVTQVTATGGQTTFNVTYTVGQLSVYLNGALLASADYTASNGTTVVLASGAAANDIFTAVAYNSATQIIQGDTKVEVTDSGTGKIEFTVDNVEVADFTTGAVVFNETGANQDFRVEGDTNANLIFADASVDKVGFGTNTFNTNGGVIQVSNGISFPATQSACSDANTLDDYEEGTWTPSCSFSTSNGDRSIAGDTKGTYVKIGKMVNIIGLLRFSESTASGDLAITGLPFAAISTSGNFAAGTVYADELTGVSGQIQFLIGGGVPTTEIFPYYSGTGTRTRITNSNTGSNTDFAFSICYQTS